MNEIEWYRNEIGITITKLSAIPLEPSNSILLSVGLFTRNHSHRFHYFPQSAPFLWLHSNVCMMAKRNRNDKAISCHEQLHLYFLNEVLLLYFLTIKMEKKINVIVVYSSWNQNKNRNKSFFYRGRIIIWWNFAFNID